jgi:hypothetical protein
MIIQGYQNYHYGYQHFPPPPPQPVPAYWSNYGYSTSTPAPQSFSTANRVNWNQRLQSGFQERHYQRRRSNQKNLQHSVGMQQPSERDIQLRNRMVQQRDQERQELQDAIVRRRNQMEEQRQQLLAQQHLEEMRRRDRLAQEQEQQRQHEQENFLRSREQVEQQRQLQLHLHQLEERQHRDRLAQQREEERQEQQDDLTENWDQLEEQQEQQDLDNQQEELNYQQQLFQLHQQAAHHPAAVIQQINLPLGRRPYHDPNHRHSLSQMNIQCSKCHALHFLSEKLAASSNRNPKFSSCCLQGKIDFPPFTNPPNFLKNLISGRSTKSTNFRNNIRQYNISFAFTSVAVNVDNTVLQSAGPYSFRIHGGLYHKMGALLPPTPDHNASYAQLYILDFQTALNQRNARNNGLDPTIMLDLQTMLHDVNPFVPLYKQVGFIFLSVMNLFLFLIFLF